jgi:hypothetical protein
VVFNLLVFAMPWIVVGQNSRPMPAVFVASTIVAASVAAMRSARPGVHVAVAIVAIGVNLVVILGLFFVPLPAGRMLNTP